MRALIDVNVLLVLLDRDHIDHERTRGWISQHIDQGWASCAITQNVVRATGTRPQADPSHD